MGDMYKGKGEDMNNSTGYTGHGSFGLQNHSKGPLWPYTVIREGARAEKFLAMDLRTGKCGRPFGSYKEAEIDAAALLVRNMMHS